MPIENQIRTFIAVRLTPELRGKALAFADKFKKLPGNLRFVEPEHLHLTIQFLGDVDAALIPSIMTACQVAAREVPPFKLELAGSGVFPNFRQPRVLWIGVANGQKYLEKLFKLLSEQLAPLGLKTEAGPFTPHLTIARIKFLNQTTNLKQLVEKTRAEAVGGQDVPKITVYKSVLAAAGPEHTIIGETYLKGE